jgi:hypothetical protein
MNVMTWGASRKGRTHLVIIWCFCRGHRKFKLLRTIYSDEALVLQGALPRMFMRSLSWLSLFAYPYPEGSHARCWDCSFHRFRNITNSGIGPERHIGLIDASKHRLTTSVRHHGVIAELSL